MSGPTIIHAPRYLSLWSGRVGLMSSPVQRWSGHGLAHASEVLSTSLVLLTKEAVIEVDRPFKALNDESCMLYAMDLYLFCATQLRSDPEDAGQAVFALQIATACAPLMGSAVEVGAAVTGCAAAEHLHTRARLPKSSGPRETTAWDPSKTLTLRSVFLVDVG